jgi:hypothetical protein
LSTTIVLLPSPFGRRAGEEGLDANRRVLKCFCALLWTEESTAEHLIPAEKNKENDGKVRRALSPALSQRERELRT